MNKDIYWITCYNKQNYKLLQAYIYREISYIYDVRVEDYPSRVQAFSLYV